jgi:N-acetylmuramoyl-L-alanine amidase CwlA
MTPKGIVVHSTGANNPYLKRYVDAPSEVGVNKNGNHWNNAKPDGRKVCVHAFIGYDKDENVKVAEILPLNICCWGVGKGKKGSYNYKPAYIQFEICEDNLNNQDYFNQVYKEACEITAYLCQMYNLNPLGTVKMNGVNVPVILDHATSCKLGFGSNHGDV